MNPIPLLTLPGIKGKQSHLVAKMQLKLWIIISKNVRTLIIEDYYYVFFNTLVSYCLRTIREAQAKYTFQVSGMHGLQSHVHFDNLNHQYFAWNFRFMEQKSWDLWWNTKCEFSHSAQNIKWNRHVFIKLDFLMLA